MIWILIGVVALIAILLAVGWFFGGELDFPAKEKWPPITEDEFIERCSPGVNRERALKVRRIISEQLGVDYDRVYPEQRFGEDLGCD